MKKVIDWKYWLMLFVGVAGVVATVWIWQSELISRSLHFQMASQTSLQPTGASTLKGVQLSIDGKEVASPFITVLRLTHDGSKPIQSSDFEGPIEIRVKEPSTLVKAQVTEVSPTDLRPQVGLLDGVVTIAPLLLNSGDTSTLAVITSGPAPQFSIRSRIAGVPIIELKDVRKRTLNKQTIVILLLVSVAFLMAAAVLISGDFTENVTLRARVATPLFVLTLVPPASIFSVLLPAYGYEGVLPIVGCLLIAFLISAPIALLLNRPNRSSTPPAPKADSVPTETAPPPPPSTH